VVASTIEDNQSIKKKAEEEVFSVSESLENDESKKGMLSVNSSPCRGEKSLIEITNELSPRYYAKENGQHHFNDKLENLKQRHIGEMDLMRQD